MAEPILSYKSIPVRPPGRPRGRASFWLALSAVGCCVGAWSIAVLELGYPADGFLFLVGLILAEVFAIQSVVHAVQSLRWTREERIQAIVGISISAPVISLGLLVFVGLLI